MKKPIRFIIVFAVAIVVIVGVNRAMQWFLHGAKDVAIERTQKNVQQTQKLVTVKDSPKKD